MDADTPIPSIEPPQQNHKAVGSTWIARYEQQRWPVVLCSENGPPEAFIKTRPKHNGVRPAILLGIHKYIWVIDDLLDEYEPSYGYLNGAPKFSVEELQPHDDDQTKTEKFRDIAFRCDAPEMRHDQYWHNFIRQQAAARKLERKIMTRKKSKRRNASTTDSSSSIIELDGSERDGHDTWLTPDSSPPPAQHAKRAKGEKTKDVIEIDDHTDSDDNMSSDESFSGKDSCHILVGQAKMSYVLHKKHLRGCDYLLDLREKNGLSGGSLIDLTTNERAIARKLSPKDFDRIVRFMKTRDVGPKYINARGDNPRISKEDSTPEQKTKWAEQLVCAFVAASKVQFEEMQKVIYDKLKTLYPLDSPGICTIACTISCMGLPENDTEQELASFVIEHITDYFYKIAKEQGSSLQRILEESKDLRRAVFEHLIENGMAGKLGLD
ncbi:uncharacterized protein MYCFIDRAFT_85024 [Pseudocercospora fijiensis CIRAD86]|uniref:PWWP domain-containing protein n=1 Tax=Pseudocercospora fijiensis (strain CIRAD86) TaxID=383855 RepID=N1Q7E7_PSEFD|nr:uncharacterized protein MYCFIDRAFT_85024 [Pseudocercospora fijiensis CIRAD86]EME88579.1 hypothetical protein MYCFIDRAFT_85024 [Pseudocercospora fijiensis CIRAD86]